MDEHAAAAPDVDRELPDRLQERQRLDVAHRAADLRDDDVDVLALAHELDAVLDLVRDVRDDLDGAAEVVAAALLADDRVVDRARGDVGGARGVRVREALVVAEVEVGLGAVLGHEHLAVLERRHRARVDVDVGVELLEGDLQPAGDQQAADRGRRDALAERRDHAAGDEDVAGARAWIWHLVLAWQSRSRGGGTSALRPLAAAFGLAGRRLPAYGRRARRSAPGARSASARRSGGRAASPASASATSSSASTWSSSAACVGGEHVGERRRRERVVADGDRARRRMSTVTRRGARRRSRASGRAPRRCRGRRSGRRGVVTSVFLFVASASAARSSLSNSGCGRRT